MQKGIDIIDVVVYNILAHKILLSTKLVYIALFGLFIRNCKKEKENENR